MYTLRQVWGSLLAWAPSSVRVALAMLLIVLVLTKLAPVVVRGLGVVLTQFWAPLIELITYPEYLVTVLCRRLGRPPVPGTFGLGRLLGLVAAGGTRCGVWLRARFARPPSFPIKTMALAVSFLAGSWYIAPAMPPGSPQTMLTQVNGDVVRVDSWLKTGQWTSAGPAPTCTPTPQVKVKPKAKPTSKPRPAS